MLIGYFADGKWAHNALDLIIARKDIQIGFICARYENPDPILKKKAINLGIDFIVEKDINNILIQEKLSKYNCDLFVSMSFNQIFKKDTFLIPKKGTINCHAGKLPFYRGRNVLNWALINDEKEFGITVHFIDENIDTGDVILQKAFPINEDDNYGTLLKKSYEQCPKLLLQALEIIMQNKVEVISQKSLNKTFMYCSKRVEGDEIINWENNSREIFNFIRALTNPGPCALTFSKSKPIKIISSKYLKDAPKYKGIPGSILQVNKDGFLIKTGDSYLQITKWDSQIKIYNGLRLNNKVI